MSARQLEYAAQASIALEPVHSRQKVLIEKNGLSKVAELEFSALPELAEIEVKRAIQNLGYGVQDTTAATLQRIVRENPDEKFAGLLLEYREIRQKIVLLRAWVEHVRDGRIYSKLEQLGGRSGRITCSKDILPFGRIMLLDHRPANALTASATRTTIK